MALSADTQAVIDRMDARMERTDRLIERNEQAFERNTRAWGHTVSALTSIRDSMEDMRGEIRAQTEAIYRVIDRMDGGRQGA